MPIEKLKLLKDEVKNYPTSPGVYLMKDRRKNIIYVGKASNLKNRTSSYFVNYKRQPKKTQILLNNIDEIEYFVTSSEEEALVLELNFIKQYRPHYNIALKDDKSFPYIKINTQEEWPRVEITRRPLTDGARYFGPYGNGVSIKRTLKVMKRIFPFRSCRSEVGWHKTRPCLEYDMGRCLGPCSNKTTQEEYQAVIEKLILFLEGRHGAVLKELEKEMKTASANQEFERAAFYRDQITNLKKILTYQEMATKVKGDRDAIAFYQYEKATFGQIFFVRSGKITGREGFFLKHTQYESDINIMTSFVKHFYNSAMEIPPTILLQHAITDRAVISNWLRGKAGRAVTISVPKKGPKKELVDLVAENAKQGLESMRFKLIKNERDTCEPLIELQNTLGLPVIPKRIEGYDISNLGGKMAVGSMVVFEKGKAVPAKYRRFRIKTVDGADDYRMLKEITSRRFGHGDTGNDSEWGVLPNLVLIDGGKGQLSSVLAAVPVEITRKVSFISIAEENEEIYTPDSNTPIVLPKNSLALQLLQRVRDEAHRFAITYHRSMCSKKSFESPLDSIPGIGPKRKKALLEHFGSVAGIREANVDEIARVKGITQELAENIKAGI
jgi:excinuclease ABC subunit C